MILNGRVGQVTGSFDANVDLLDEGNAIREIIKEYDDSSKPILLKIGIQAPEGTIVVINEQEIKVGKTGIYELDCLVPVTSLKFKENVEAIVDFVY